MQTKKSIKVECHRDSDIKQFDSVMFKDGSGISCDEYKDGDMYIVHSYPKITSSNEPLIELVFTVVKTNIEDRVIFGCLGTGYVQDLELVFNGKKFRTPSNFVYKVG